MLLLLTFSRQIGQIETDAPTDRSTSGSRATLDWSAEELPVPRTVFSVVEKEVGEATVLEKEVGEATVLEKVLGEATVVSTSVGEVTDADA